MTTTRLFVEEVCVACNVEVPSPVSDCPGVDTHRSLCPNCFAKCKNCPLCRVPYPMPTPPPPVVEVPTTTQYQHWKWIINVILLLPILNGYTEWALGIWIMHDHDSHAAIGITQIVFGCVWISLSTCAYFFYNNVVWISMWIIMTTINWCGSIIISMTVLSATNHPLPVYASGILGIVNIFLFIAVLIILMCTSIRISTN